VEHKDCGQENSEGELELYWELDEKPAIFGSGKEFISVLSIRKLCMRLNLKVTDWAGGVAQVGIPEFKW
jgi:hypothetical protein